MVIKDNKKIEIKDNKLYKLTSVGITKLKYQ